MRKRTTTLILTICALAVVVSPTAAEAVTFETGQATLEAGALVKLESGNSVFTIGGQTKVECEVLGSEGELVGSGVNITGIASVGSGQNCAIQPYGASYLIEATEVEIAFGPAGNGKMLMAYFYSIPAANLYSCALETVGTGLGVSYETGGQDLSVSGGPWLGSGGMGCPSGLEKYEASFALTTPSGAPITIE